MYVYAECHVQRREGFDSLFKEMGTGYWCTWWTWEVEEIFQAWRWEEAELVGSAWATTGVLHIKHLQLLEAKLFLSGLLHTPQGKLLLHGMLLLQTGTWDSLIPPLLTSAEEFQLPNPLCPTRLSTAFFFFFFFF